ncbi:MAG: type II toxin-antitoxin system VapC family toxin [Rhodanobacteraceae bacterium]|nr:type II toxin-antitoxin system VapC family toxin [Rhodanobacteraceae bacterium]MBL0040381.1 type II toxin-antitoxin system VapC family toxin [Xanthomonadales bacterium]MBP6079367.1 type II toxin-antitoxin system VapC family toxin [Xanthomonadales bacterium]MBP7622778.1 type II toxin-antitoxin system VapC family toxin [Xanthomonadales bacterium]
MKLLLDTHALIWALEQNPKLSSRALDAMHDATNPACFSIASFWEIAIKRSLAKLQLPEDWLPRMSTQMAANAIERLDITPNHCRRVESLPHHHRDPFDRMLVAQALAGNLTVVSADPSFDVYGVNRLW